MSEASAPPQLTAIAAAGPDPAPTTPLPRLLTAMAMSVVGSYIALLTPIQLLLTLRLTTPASAGAARGSSPARWPARSR